MQINALNPPSAPDSPAFEKHLFNPRFREREARGGRVYVKQGHVCDACTYPGLLYPWSGSGSQISRLT